MLANGFGLSKAAALVGSDNPNWSRSWRTSDVVKGSPVGAWVDIAFISPVGEWQVSLDTYSMSVFITSQAKTSGILEVPFGVLTIIGLTSLTAIGLDVRSASSSGDAQILNALAAEIVDLEACCGVLASTSSCRLSTSITS
jgi:hypothetical protein